MITCPHRCSFGGCARFALVLALVAGLAACQGSAGGSLDGAGFVLTSSGGYVLSKAPPGIEVTLGSKQLRPAREASSPERQTGPDSRSY
jgi:hypothetical protein